MSDLQYLLNGVDVENYARILTTIGAGMSIVGGDDAVPFRPGEIFQRRTAGPGDLLLGLSVSGADGTSGDDSIRQYLANWAGLKALCWDPNTPKTLVRRTTLPDGSVVEAASPATLNAFPQENKQGPHACLTVLDFKLLDGYLYGTSDVTVTSPGTVSVLGDTSTTRMVITMAAGATLTNTTTGASLHYSGTGTVTVDVQNWTATAGGSPAAGFLSWPASGHDYWFDLAPGANVLTGVASIAYRPAYLP